MEWIFDAKHRQPLNAFRTYSRSMRMRVYVNEKEAEFVH